MAKRPAPGVEEPREEISEEVSPTAEIDTSDWKIYRNEKYGFEMKYPPEGKVIVGPKGGGLIFLGVRSIEGYGYGVTVDVLKNQKGLPLPKWYSEYYMKRKKEAEMQAGPFLLGKSGEYVKLKNFLIYRVSTFHFDSMIIDLYISQDGYIYNFSYIDESINDPDWVKHQNLIYTMLSSLSFTK